MHGAEALINWAKIIFHFVWRQRTSWCRRFCQCLVCITCLPPFIYSCHCVRSMYPVVWFKISPLEEGFGIFLFGRKIFSKKCFPDFLLFDWVIACENFSYKWIEIIFHVRLGWLSIQAPFLAVFYLYFSLSRSFFLLDTRTMRTYGEI